MGAKPQVDTQFNVTSGCLCYGDIHNVWHGTSSPICKFPTSVEQHAGGTVTAQIISFNTLVEKGTDRLCAWFASHVDVDPEVEIDKILNVSGSPYERDSGSRLNDKKTAKESVLVINRYDWGYYDKRGKEELGIDDTAETDWATWVFGEGAALVDFESAKTEVLRWNEKKRQERDNSPNGVWMFIPGGEYMFGRFGFDEDRSGARSFLFFTTYTNFCSTSFVGTDRALRVEETDEEWFQRCLRKEGYFEGLVELKQQISWFNGPLHLPAESEYLGPYDSRECILTSTDIDAIRIRPGVKAHEFADPLKEDCLTCLNEMIMSYLEHFIAPASSHNTVVAACCLIPYSDPIPGFNDRAVGSKIKSFLIPRCEDKSLVRDEKFIAGICACIAYLLSEVLELANNHAGRRSKLIPVDIRLAVFMDTKLRDLFKYSRFFWKGNSQIFQVAGASRTTELTQTAE
ncbi:uncharacterized protein LY89DRAFT_710302 [Mollisia scopiformis]|uniref:Uncharacterized protein n=1 Tax=Mollisia scopiformis TaxID=149040 RepID=A0A194WT60_MOLSC|nr:uncharacterized protein LY89DRAFT_710302 [Mollisia scopiformis]KUJ11146.1 hypothetical protein LY89DRAFT_710302 [Mollisia scopiformis]